MAKEINKTEVKINKPICLDLHIRKIAMYECWYDYIEQKYGDKTKLCLTDTDSYIVYVKYVNDYINLAGDIEHRFDTLNYEINKTLPMEKIKR